MRPALIGNIRLHAFLFFLEDSIWGGKWVQIIVWLIKLVLILSIGILKIQHILHDRWSSFLNFGLFISLSAWLFKPIVNWFYPYHHPIGTLLFLIPNQNLQTFLSFHWFLWFGIDDCWFSHTLLFYDLSAVDWIKWMILFSQVCGLISKFFRAKIFKCLAIQICLILRLIALFSGIGLIILEFGIGRVMRHRGTMGFNTNFRFKDLIISCNCIVMNSLKWILHMFGKIEN